MARKTLGIDQSLRGTGLCLLDDDCQEARPQVLETLALDDTVGLERVEAIVARVIGVVREHHPDLVVMEDYAMGASNTNNITRLAEIGGVLKLEIARCGYSLGYGHGRNAEERERYWANTRVGGRLFVLQTQSQMKKFCLGQGNVKKDEGYLLKVMQRIGSSFEDSNQADAFMHAWMANIVCAVIRGDMPFDNLPRYQQEVLLEKGRKTRKGLSMNQAIKLSSDEKLQLVRM